MSTDTTYNGWANRATWLVNLHLTNDQGLYLASRDAVRHGYLIAADDYVSPEDDETMAMIGGAINEAGQDGTFEQVYATLRASDATPEHGVGTIHDRATWNARNALEVFVDELVYIEGRGAEDSLRNDLLGAALADVDWAEIADHMLDES